MTEEQKLKTLLRLKELLLQMPPGKWEIVDVDDAKIGEFLVLAHNYLWDELKCDTAVEKAKHSRGTIYLYDIDNGTEA